MRCAQAAGLSQIVGHPHDPEPGGGQLPGQGLDATPVVRVERRGRLVHEQDLGAGEQGAGDADPLGLASREVVGHPVEEPGVETDLPEPGGELLVVGVAVGHLEVVADGAGEDHRPLEHHADPTPQLPRIERRRVPALEPDHAPEGTSSRLPTAEQRRLPGARRAGDDRDRAAVDLDVDTVEQHHALAGDHPDRFEGKDRIRCGQGIWGHGVSMTPRGRPLTLAPWTRPRTTRCPTIPGRTSTTGRPRRPRS